ncbi:integrase arm-type DNA-binding domain-containing protein [Shewanella marisflavi]|uniref:tyrosine-type recombinase/integrase n=1 Tax=Shewanella marisflavi TaxID=260364 RepID=UPI00200BF5CF|nr:site-specific integrase [Shewanella marisflavi]MCL1041405.1 integrase arm-type DNA-binding domain-containing protein [Shewanella marisflavi]
MALTDSWLKANLGKPSTKAFERADRDGLSIRVSAKGVITFQMRYQWNGKGARIDIGPYPLMSLKEARDLCEEQRKLLLNGIDPREAKREKAAKANGDDGTIESIFRAWHNSQFGEGRSNVKEQTAKEYLRALEINVFPTLGNKQVDKVSFHQWLDLLESLAAKKPTATNLVLGVSRRALKWAVRRRLIKVNELAGIESKEDLNISLGSRSRILSDDELAILLQGIELANRQRLGNRILVFLALFYGCRIGELRLALKQHFDLDKMIWTVPVENHKTGYKMKRALVRPIIEEVKPVIELAMSLSETDIMFPTKDGEFYSQAVVTRMARPIITWSIKNGTPLDNDWTMHDLRRTQRTNMSKITTTEVAETMLGHKLDGVQSIYDHHDYLEEQAKAYKVWWHKLQKLKDPAAYENVVELKAVK